jgi:eukaryotic-like serine/threonine-protein kinase
MATVHVGIVREGPDAGRVVAVKMIREEFARSAEFAAMFLDEARIVGGLRHPNVLRYDELGREGGHPFIAMELLYGQSLWSAWEACRARGVRLRYPTIAWIGARVADGLHYAHEATDAASRPLDVVHRDVNPANVFVTYEGEVKVIDFGLAKAKNRASRTAAGVIKGKVAYMSPEQAVGGALDRRSDVFALGTTLWELACDRRLFKHVDEVETLRRVNAASVPDATGIVDGFPRPLWRILERALARDPGNRYQTAAAMALDLDAFAREAPGAPDARSLAEVMGALFPGDAARQRTWVSDVTAPGSTGGSPLKARSTFSGAEADDHPAPPAPRRRATPLWRIAVVLLGAIAVAALIALALR